jgi:DNA-binding response OmpR family regulator
MAEKTVLIVDDDLRISAMLKTFLSEFGYHVVVVNDGVSAVHGALNKKPDLALIDVRMPGMDGIAVVTAIKNMTIVDPEKRRPRIMLMSGVPERQTIEKAKELKVDGFILKPFNLKDLRTRIELHLAKLDFAELREMLGFARRSSNTPDADEFRRFGANWVSYSLHYKGTDYQLMIAKTVDIQQVKSLVEAEAKERVTVYCKVAGGWHQAWPTS